MFAVDVVAVDVVAVEMFAVGDSGSTRTVLAAIAFLVAIGIGLLVLAGWLVRATRADPEVLAPLEVMGERSWRRADPVWQRRQLDEVRPSEAEPLEPMAAPPALDAEFDLGPQLGDFSDFDDLLRTLGVDLGDAAPAARGDATMAPPPSDPEVISVGSSPDDATGDDTIDDDPGDASGDDAGDAQDDQTAPVHLDRYDEGHGNVRRRRDDRPVP
ncbi:MAG: hypothetical protein WD225_04580 [Ilumatobacteraceae bacterium]